MRSIKVFIVMLLTLLCATFIALPAFAHGNGHGNGHGNSHSHSQGNSHGNKHENGGKHDSDSDSHDNATHETKVAKPSKTPKPTNSGHKVTLCHRTNSNTNPYVQITVDVDSVFKQGHDGHNGPVYNPTLKAQHVKWGDIIPSFDYVTHQGQQVHYSGKNLTADGVAILNADCAVPVQPTPTPTATTPVPTPTHTSPVPTPTHSTPAPKPTKRVLHFPSHPPFSPQPQPSVPGRGPAPHSLAFTGSNLWPELLIGGLAILVGLGTVVLARRRSV